MAEKLIGSLIHGEHVIPKKARPWKERLKVPAAIGLVLIVIGGAAYKFANYREESRVHQFLESVIAGRYEAAFADWDAGGSYGMKEFLEDWGKEGFYTKGASRTDVIDSNSSGKTVIVYVEIDTFNEPVAIMVDKETLKLSYSPVNKYAGRRR
jgi:hypothetical protein